MPVQHIRPIEQVSVDHDRLGALYVQLGEAGAEDVVCRALEELAQRLNDCDAQYHKQGWTDLRVTLQALIAIGEQIGMHAVGLRAKDAMDCLNRNDQIALAATLSRLIRVGERSLTAVWDMQNVPF